MSLPTWMTVYSDDHSVAILGPEGKERVLPIVNHHRGLDACYVAVYSHQQAGASYGIGGGLWVHGLIRMHGQYDARGIAQPAGYEGKDISAAPALKRLAHDAFPKAGACWLGGDTGGFRSELELG